MIRYKGVHLMLKQHYQKQTVTGAEQVIIVD
jgi:hypothetical protein